jgi:hypothetical protein
MTNANKTPKLPGFVKNQTLAPKNSTDNTGTEDAVHQSVFMFLTTIVTTHPYIIVLFSAVVAFLIGSILVQLLKNNTNNFLGRKTFKPYNTGDISKTSSALDNINKTYDYKHVTDIDKPTGPYIARFDPLSSYSIISPLYRESCYEFVRESDFESERSVQKHIRLVGQNETALSNLNTFKNTRIVYDSEHEKNRPRTHTI